jgi:hypothetical protein
MISKIWNTKLLHILLGAVFLSGMLPISTHTMSMRLTDMNTVATPGIKVQETTNANAMGTCCEAIGSLLVCDFMSFPSVCINQNRGGEKIAHSNPVIKLIYIESLAPPPKA